MLDFDVLEVLGRQVLQHLGQLVQKKLLESWVVLDLFNPVLKENVKTNPCCYLGGNQGRESMSIFLFSLSFASSNYFAKARKGPALVCGDEIDPFTK